MSFSKILIRIKQLIINNLNHITTDVTD